MTESKYISVWFGNIRAMLEMATLVFAFDKIEHKFYETLSRLEEK